MCVWWLLLKLNPALPDFFMLFYSLESICYVLGFCVIIYSVIFRERIYWPVKQ